MNWNEIKKFIRYHIANSKIGVVLSNTKEISEPITKAVDDLSKTIQGKRNDIVNPESISDPIVEAQNATTEAIRGINIPEPITPDMKPLEEHIKSLLDAVKAQDLVVNQGDVNVDLKPVIKAIEKIKLEVPKMEKQEVIDYTLMFDEMMKIMESKEDLKLQELVTKLGTSEDLGVLAEWLKAISLKEYPEFPELKFNKEGRLMIEVDKVGGGGGGGMTSIQETYLKTISDNQSTEAKQDDLIGNYTSRITENGGYTYIGEALPASATSSAVWRISRVNSSGTELWANGNTSFTHIYDDILIISFT